MHMIHKGMALETVDRVDDARKIYGKLAANNWCIIKISYIYISILCI